MKIHYLEVVHFKGYDTNEVSRFAFTDYDIAEEFLFTEVTKISNKLGKGRKDYEVHHTDFSKDLGDNSTLRVITMTHSFDKIEDNFSTSLKLHTLPVSDYKSRVKETLNPKKLLSFHVVLPNEETILVKIKEKQVLDWNWEMTRICREIKEQTNLDVFIFPNIGKDKIYEFSTMEGSKYLQNICVVTYDGTRTYEKKVGRVKFLTLEGTSIYLRPVTYLEIDIVEDEGYLVMKLQRPII